MVLGGQQMIRMLLSRHVDRLGEENMLTRSRCASGGPSLTSASRLGLPCGGGLMLALQVTTRSSLAAEQLSHRLVVGDSTRPACGDSLAVRCERRLDLSFFEDFGRGAAYDRLEPPQLR
jgi:hypothetical protein